MSDGTHLCPHDACNYICVVDLMRLVLKWSPGVTGSRSVRVLAGKSGICLSSK